MEFSNKKTNKITVLTVLSLLILGMSYAQIDSKSQKSEFWQKVRIGGALGFSFRGSDFSGTIAPSALYDVNQKISFGIGLNASVYNRKNYSKSTVLGGSLIALFNPIRELQLSAEFEKLHVNRKYEGDIREDRKYWYPALFLGAGYRTGNLSFGMRYDVLYDRQESIYSEAWIPFIRFYF